MSEDKIIKRKRVGLFIKLMVAGVFLAGAFVLYVNLAAQRAGQGQLYDDVLKVPAQSVGLLLAQLIRLGREIISTSPIG